MHVSNGTFSACMHDQNLEGNIYIYINGFNVSMMKTFPLKKFLFYNVRNFDFSRQIRLFKRI